jgi:hypothetical protein
VRDLNNQLGGSPGPALGSPGAQLGLEMEGVGSSSAEGRSSFRNGGSKDARLRYLEARRGSLRSMVLSNEHVCAPLVAGIVALLAIKVPFFFLLLCFFACAVRFDFYYYYYYYFAWSSPPLISLG